MPPRLLRSARATAIVALGLFVYVLFLRTRHISETFELLGDQMLYWDIALRPIRDLPIGGGPTSVGGTTLGPAFIWTMAAIRRLIGPFTANLPHAGGIGISLIQSAADAFLLVAIWKRFGSMMLALAVTLLVATPQELSLSASIWNPPVAVAFTKASIACVLLAGADGSLWWDASAVAAAVLAVQCHSSAIFFAAPLLTSLIASDWWAGHRDRVQRIACMLGTVLLLEVPFLADLVAHPTRQTSPTRVVGSVAATLAHPASLRPVAAFEALVNACQDLVRPWTPVWLAMLVLACLAVAAFRLRRDLRLAAITLAPPVVAVAGFSFWQAGFESYWFMTLMPSVGLAIGLAVTAWRPVSVLAGAALLAAVVVAQPGRYADSLTINRLPEYAAIVRGSQEIRRRMPEVRSIDLEFPVPPTTSSTYIYERILGGHVTRDAPFAAAIDQSGHVRFTAMPAS